MKIAIVMIALFGVFNIVGGLIGFLKASSIASLIAGGISGILLLFCSFGISKGNKIAAIGAIVISLLLCGRFIPKLLTQVKVMPDLIIVIVSIISILVLIPIFKELD